MTKTLSKKRSRKFAPLPFVLFLLISVGMASTVWNLWLLHQDVDQRIFGLDTQKLALLEQQKKLKSEIERLNDPAYVEQLAREQLGLVRHGEITIAPKK
ncbi:MAG: FtsB family cell division protein [Desulfitobacteriaceae bacterium]